MNSLHSNLINATNNATKAITRFANVYFKFRRSSKRWRMQNVNGQNKKEKKRSQTMLRGRRCRVHKGLYPSRGKKRRANL